MSIPGIRSLLVVDDHAVVRDGVKHIVDEGRGLTAFGEASTADEALIEASRRRYDAAVIELALGGHTGLELLRELRRRHPGMPVLVLTAHTEEQYGRRALRGGAAGYLTKDSPRIELLRALRKVAGGGRYVSATLAERLAGDLEQALDQPPHELLSDRELAVLSFLAAGHPVGEIARVLALSTKTVSTYRARLLAKMRMRSNAELTRYAIHNQLVQ